MRIIGDKNQISEDVFDFIISYLPFPQKSISSVYLFFLRPFHEYASVVWDNCTVNEKDKLEKIQIEAGRNVTGLTRSNNL